MNEFIVITGQLFGGIIILGITFVAGAVHGENQLKREYKNGK